MKTQVLTESSSAPRYLSVVVYSHPLFLKGRYDLCSQIITSDKDQKIRDTGGQGEKISHDSIHDQLLESEHLIQMKKSTNVQHSVFPRERERNRIGCLQKQSSQSLHDLLQGSYAGTINGRTLHDLISLPGIPGNAGLFHRKTNIIENEVWRLQQRAQENEKNVLLTLLQKKIRETDELKLQLALSAVGTGQVNLPLSTSRQVHSTLAPYDASVRHFHTSMIRERPNRHSFLPCTHQYNNLSNGPSY